MRSRALLLSLIPVVALALPLAAHATGIPFFATEGIVPVGAQKCAANWTALFQTVQNLVAFIVTIAIVFIAPILIAYAGFLFVVNPANPSAKDKAKKVLSSTVLGIVVALAAWLIVDAVLVALTGSGKGVSYWTALFDTSGQGPCLDVATKLNQGAIGATTPGVGVTPGGGGTGLTYTAQAQKQIGDASGAISSLITCISGRLTTGGGTVTSISDHIITDGTHDFAYCAANSCSHAAHSCHYGGTKCVGRSYAVDIASSNYSLIEAAAKECDANAWINNEGTHVHISDGAEYGCGCDESGVDNP